MIKRAILSVYEKTGIVDLARKLVAMEVEILSTGGTLKALSEAGIPVTPVQDVTGFPECFDGRVKTLHPKIHGGILAMRGNAEHQAQMRELEIEPIDLVVINLYPFRDTISKPGVTLPEAIENIDIGGPTMLRAAAKNFQDVTVVVDPSDYGLLIGEMQELGGEVSRNTRLRFAEKVFAHTAQYDALIAKYLRAQEDNARPFPQKLTLTFEREGHLRYGENPHQQAAFYRELLPEAGSLPDIVQLSGENLSYNNLLDADLALRLLREFDNPLAAAIKQGNPRGVCARENIGEAWALVSKMVDATTLHGCTAAFNREVDAKLAEALKEAQVVIAPGYTDDALEILQCTVLRANTAEKDFLEKSMDFRRVSGGLLVQQYDLPVFPSEHIRIVTQKNPSPPQTQDAVFAWTVAKYVHSNAIVVAKNLCTLGIGSGQGSRVWASMEAIARSGESAKGAALASDAFLQYPGSVEAAAEAGIATIIQTGGSPVDAEITAICDEKDMVMLLAGMRHLKQ